MKIETYILLEDKDICVPLVEQDEIKRFTDSKEDLIVEDLLLLDGTITFKHKNDSIADFENLDSINTLWHYYTNVLFDFLDEGYGQVYYPDLPLEITLEKRSKKELILSLEDQILVCDIDIFLKEFYKAGTKFIELRNVITDGKYDDDLKKSIKKLKKYID